MDYPYMISNNKIDPILGKIKTAAKPNRLTHQLLKKWGFTSSNDRAIIPLLKRLGFLHENGMPTEYYDRLKDPTEHAYILAARIQDLYSDLFAINTNMQNAQDDEIKGAISRITGRDEKDVHRYFLTFKALVGLAKFEPVPPKLIKKREEAEEEEIKPTVEWPARAEPQFHYNIQIHLPATSDISVYNAIFKSLKENLMM